MAITRATGQATGAIGTATAVQAYPNDVVAGNLVVVVCTHVDSVTTVLPRVSFLSQTAGSATLGPISMDVSFAALYGGPVVKAAAIYSAVVLTGGSLTFTYNPSSGAAECLIAIQEYEGADVTANRVINKAYSAASSTAPATAILDSGAAAVFVGGLSCVLGANLVITPGGGYATIFEQETYGPSEQGSGIDQIVSLPTPLSASWTLDLSSGWVAVLAIYREAVTYAPPPVLDWGPVYSIGGRRGVAMIPGGSN